jgi:putative lipoprotein
MRLSLFLCVSLLLACAPREVARDSARADTNATADSARPEGSGVPWEDARSRGIDFRAVGQEPGWFAEIDDGKSIYVFADYGEKKVTTPAPAPRDSAGVRLYEVTKEATRLTIRIETVPCADAMSGEQMTHTVTMNLDGREYRGCGRRLMGP